MSAADATVTSTLTFLRSSSQAFLDSFSRGEYALWTGAGISQNRTASLKNVVERVLDFLQAKTQSDDADGAYELALRKVVALADIPGMPARTPDLAREPNAWTEINQILDGLVNKYSKVLDVQVARSGLAADYLLWDATDFAQTFGQALDPDSEHLLIGVLIAEGVVPEIASANWDGMIEAAATELLPSHDDLGVRIRAEDFQIPTPRAKLLKFHGCAIKAVSDELIFRPLLIGRQTQITRWPNDAAHAVMMGELVRIASQRPTLMVGLSAQDTDIQAIFSKARESIPWTWPHDPPTHVFAEDQLGPFQDDLLKVVYDAQYAPNQVEIHNRSVVPAYGKPLFAALALFVLFAKLDVALNAAGLSWNSDRLKADLKGLMDSFAAQMATDSAHVRLGIRSVAQLLSVFRGGVVLPASNTAYEPLSLTHVGALSSEPGLASSGLPEFSIALGLLAAGQHRGSWYMEFDSVLATGTIRINSSGRTSKILMVSNEHAEVEMRLSGNFDPDDPSIVLVRATHSSASRVRSPRSRLGRPSSARVVSIRALVDSGVDEHGFRTQFENDALL